MDRKMLAVVTKADHPELFDIVRTLFHAMIEDDEASLDINPPAWEQIEKFNLGESFWQMIKTRFGYAEDLPSLRNLLLRLFVSDYTHKLKTEIPTALQNLQLSRSGTANAVVCLEELKKEESRAWLEIEYTGSDITSNLRDMLDEALADSTMEIRRIKNRRVMDRVINAIAKDETLDDLDAGEVFTRCLDAFDVPDDDREELTASYNEVIKSLHEEDVNAE